MKNSSADGAKPYPKFERCLKDWEAFKNAAINDEDHWFKDLLRLWRPSGQLSEEYGLRLAIRNNYLNFYRLGQSVARVACVRGKLVADVHYKYVLGEQSGYSGPLYLRLNAEGHFPEASNARSYEGPATLQEWIKVASEYVGDEKSIVDELVEKNDNVIDLEMALPAWSGRNAADRMDLVAVEDGKVVFWEVKTVNDSRIRCDAPFEEDKSPHVLQQLYHYRVYLAEERHREQMEGAYREAATLLVKLRALAHELGQKRQLGPSIVAASQAAKLDVPHIAALVVVGLKPHHKQADSSWTSWKKSHEGKLLNKIPMCVMESPGRLAFADAQSGQEAP